MKRIVDKISPPVINKKPVTIKNPAKFFVMNKKESFGNTPAEQNKDLEAELPTIKKEF